MTYNKVFFHHAGPGIGDLMQTLDTAEIPFTIKSVKNGGFAAEGALLAKTSGVPHNIIYRDPNPLGAVNDEPAYDLSPLEAAGEHWARVQAALPPEVVAYKDIIWIEPTNEIDTHTKARWLGQFCYEIAIIANQEGFRIALAGFNAGQPDIGQWSLYFQPFLQLCADRPEQVSVSLHEGKIGDMHIPPWSDRYYPWLIGRYTFLFDACDRLGIGRPTTFISEWAWAYNDMPGIEEAMRDVAWLSEEVAKYPSIRGVCLWNLGRGEQWGDLPNKLVNLIEPIKDFTLNTVWPDPEPVEPPSPPIKVPPRSIQHTIHLLPQDTTLEELQLLTEKLYPTRSAFTFSHDVAHAVGYAGTEDSKVVIWDAERWGEDIKVYFDSVGIGVELRDFDDTPAPPPWPTGEAQDMAKYFWPLVGDYGPIITLENNWGQGNERVQLQRGPNGASYVTKNQQWEKRVINGDYIDLVMDTSPGDNEYYTSTGHWMPRTWGAGWADFNGHTEISFKEKGNCEPVPGKTYVALSKLRFVAHHDNWITPNGELAFSDVVQIVWVHEEGWIDETYWFAAGVGLVRWLRHDGDESRVIEFIDVGEQDNNVREVIPCAT